MENNIEENNIEENNNNPEEHKICCGICNIDLTFSTEYYICIECVPDFLWCKKCHSHSEKDKAENFGEEGRQVTATKSWHMHRSKPFKVDIYTPSKRNHQFQ